MPGETKGISTVIFDVGNVILHFDYLRTARRFADVTGLEQDVIEQHFFFSEWERLYSTGKLTTDEINTAKDQLTGHLQKLENALSQSSWIVGDQFTLGDIHVFPFVRQLANVTPPHPEFEQSNSTRAWLEKILARPTFKKTMSK